MSLELWLAFTLASMALLAIPGPTVMLVVSYVMGRGRGSAWATVPGVVLGDFTAMTLSLLGAGVVLQASSGLFTLLKIAGAFYLVWLGIKLWRTKPELPSVSNTPAKDSDASMFWSTYVVTSLNPKGIIFFIAFLPQFIDPALPALQQFIVMEITFLTLAAMNIILWVLLAAKLRTGFNRPSTLKIINRIGGSILIAAGALTAVTQR
ncbi:MAG: LysE family translocator [Rhizobiaceae bacterium]|nr:LysE family translocator [Rhizobiaceae bacterium]